ncbi:MAG: hypothetical protein Q8941_01330 [Bacteroidota bacterium]|nr:hypothetical protein [Bacteroidota bacterium]
MAKPSQHASPVFTKIIIPVVTTLLGASALYFLGFDKKPGSGPESFLVTREATIKAWKSFVTSQNISYKNGLSITDEYGKKIGEEAQKGLEALMPLLRDYEEELLRESGKATRDIEDILKTENIDEGFVLMLSRTRDNGKNQEKKVASFFDIIISLAKSNIGDQEKG